MLLLNEGVSPNILTDDMTEAYICLWLAEADVREAEIRSRAAWLRWGLASGLPPATHPQLRPRSKPMPLEVACPEDQVGAPHVPSTASNTALGVSWQSVLEILKTSVPASDFIAWIKPCRLVECEPRIDEDNEPVAVIETPNILVREEFERRYQTLVEDALRMTLGYATQVCLVISMRS